LARHTFCAQSHLKKQTCSSPFELFARIPTEVSSSPGECWRSIRRQNWRGTIRSQAKRGGQDENLCCRLSAGADSFVV
jgi:hypothetical protein